MFNIFKHQKENSVRNNVSSNTSQIKALEAQIENLEKMLFGDEDWTKDILYFAFGADPDARKTLETRIKNIRNELHRLYEYLNIEEVDTPLHFAKIAKKKSNK